MSDTEPQVTSKMLKDIIWIHSILKVMGHGFNKTLTAEYVGRSREFVMGCLYERERRLREQSTTDSSTKRTD